MSKNVEVRDTIICSTWFEQKRLHFLQEMKIYSCSSASCKQIEGSGCFPLECELLTLKTLRENKKQKNPVTCSSSLCLDILSSFVIKKSNVLCLAVQSLSVEHH